MNKGKGGKGLGKDGAAPKPIDRFPKGIARRRGTSVGLDARSVAAAAVQYQYPGYSLRSRSTSLSPMIPTPRRGSVTLTPMQQPSRRGSMDVTPDSRRSSLTLAPPSPRSPSSPLMSATALTSAPMNTGAVSSGQPLPGYITALDRTVPIGGGMQRRVDANGAWQKEEPAPHAAKYTETQADARLAGGTVMDTFLKLDAKGRGAALKFVENAAQASWGAADTSSGTGIFSKDHPSRAEKWWRNRGDGKAFRNLDKRLDEHSQSQTTTHFFQAMRDRAGSNDDALAFGANAAKYLSSLRMLTTDTAAPISKTGGTQGQRHPTDAAMPKWEGGGSAHTQADRERSALWISVVKASLSAAKEPGRAIVEGGMAAARFTLSNMSLPFSASNVSSGAYSSEMKDTQPQRREVLKAQINAVAKGAGYQTAPGRQSFSSPVKPVGDFAASPMRKNS